MKHFFLINIILLFFCSGLLAQKADKHMAIAYEKAREGNYRLALKHYSKVIKYDPTRSEAFYHRGNIRYDLKDYRGAIEDCVKALQLDPNLKDAYFNVAISKYHLKEYKAAIQSFNQAISINQNDHEAYCWRGMSYFHLEKLKEACIDWNKAKDLGNSYVNSYLAKHCQEENGVETGQNDD